MAFDRLQIGRAITELALIEPRAGSWTLREGVPEF